MFFKCACALLGPSGLKMFTVGCILSSKHAWCLWVILIFIETKSVTSGSGVIVCKSSDSIFRNVQEIQKQSFPEPPIFRFCFAQNLNVKCIVLIKNLFQLKYLPFFLFVLLGFSVWVFVLGLFRKSSVLVHLGQV